jgi:hypothetical protein
MVFFADVPTEDQSNLSLTSLAEAIPESLTSLPRVNLETLTPPPEESITLPNKSNEERDPLSPEQEEIDETIHQTLIPEDVQKSPTLRSNPNLPSQPTYIVPTFNPSAVNMVSTSTQMQSIQANTSTTPGLTSSNQPTNPGGGPPEGGPPAGGPPAGGGEGGGGGARLLGGGARLLGGGARLLGGGARLLGGEPDHFKGDHHNVEHFLSDLINYIDLNTLSPTLASFKTRVHLALSFISGDQVLHWKNHMLDWVCPNAINDNQDTWDQFVDQFRAQYDDTFKGD